MATAKKTPSKPVAAKPKTPVAAKAASKPAPTKKPAVAKPAAAKPKTTAAPAKKPAKVGNTVPQNQRAHYIEVAAFYIAERRGFTPGDPLQDWVAAEAEIDRLLAEGRLG